MTGKLSIAVVCAPGLEHITSAEISRLKLSGLSATPGRLEPGLLEYTGDLGNVQLLNLHVRTASRVVVRLGSFHAAAFSELRKKASRLPWSSHVTPGQSVRLRVTTNLSSLYHKKGIAERVAGALGDALGRPSPVVAGDDDGPAEAQLVVVHFLRNRCTISIDSSGDHLHRRGYRLETGKAPLRETLAAAVVLASGWPMNTPLVDPFCGSGTIPIEAALMAGGIPPGLNRSFAFEKWPGFDRGAWEHMKQGARDAVCAVSAQLFGSDRDAGAVRIAEANAERAGVGKLCSWQKQSISDLSLPAEAGWIVTNPPYGERVKGGPDLRNLYARMGSVWRKHANLWHIYQITSSPRWTGQLGLSCDSVARFANGGIPVSLYKVQRHDDIMDESGLVRGA
ncbi:MAG TPA: class I SAM-dependent RNA methyltransferase [Kiritimatiellia bacterium]|nr:class I SAM-dependent RNA methyltransferase [Kiritimatiellia bacterium]